MSGIAQNCALKNEKIRLKGGLVNWYVLFQYKSFLKPDQFDRIFLPKEIFYKDDVFERSFFQNRHYILSNFRHAPEHGLNAYN